MGLNGGNHAAVMNSINLFTTVRHCIVSRVGFTGTFALPFLRQRCFASRRVNCYEPYTSHPSWDSILIHAFNHAQLHLLSAASTEGSLYKSAYERIEITHKFSSTFFFFIHCLRTHYFIAVKNIYVAKFTRSLLWDTKAQIPVRGH